MLKLSALAPFAVPAIAEASAKSFNARDYAHVSSLVILTGAPKTGKTSMARTIATPESATVLIDIDSVRDSRAVFTIGHHGSGSNDYPMRQLMGFVLEWAAKERPIVLVVPHSVVCPVVTPTFDGGLSTSIPSVVEAARWVVDVRRGGTMSDNLGVFDRYWDCCNYGKYGGSPHPYRYHAPPGKPTHIDWPDSRT
jgi:hypothetical protein